MRRADVDARMPFRNDARFDLVPKLFVQGSETVVDGTIFLTHFTAPTGRTVSTIQTATDYDSTLTGATYARLGIYKVETDGSYSILARTANLATRWNAPGTFVVDTAAIADNGASTPAAITQLALAADQEYAAALLRVGGSGTPKLGAFFCNTALNSMAPKMSCRLDGQTGLPPSIPAGNPYAMYFGFFASLG